MQRKAPNDLGHLRAPVGNFDAALIHILAQKFHCTQAVGVLKACYMPAEDRTRERCQVAHLWQLALESHLDPDFTEKFLQLTTQEVIDNRKIIFEENKKN
ncbi:chorismate mutase [Bartonella sp. JB15]|uniref:chorismate mutase n=1 Tax=Bartonella sp. JB15 TaxID=1933906 RepID=UPI00099AC941|nr:chorismate mutase [Bartonella sp. JB15]AQX28542.1 chorismate mutase [Bartonella sp. JB15]